MFATELLQKAEALVSHCRARRYWVATAESCTGGLVGALLTSVPGSSDVYERGFITYSNDAKRELLGVEELALRDFGAVSCVVAEQMAAGALRHSHTQFAISITGIAGPGGGSAEKPVGLVWFGLAAPNGVVKSVERRFGDLGREGVRHASVETAIDLLLSATDAPHQDAGKLP